MSPKTSHARPKPLIPAFPAIKVSADGECVQYLTALPAKGLFRVCFVARADEDPKAGFQRTLSEKRANSIAEYLDDGNVIPGAIILSAKEAANLSFDESTKTLKYHDVPKAFFVIDGQHRLFGASRAKSDVVLAVSILTSLDLESEARYFNDINGEQRGVPATLQMEIQKFTEPVGSPDQLRIKIFHSLNTRVDSPLANRLSATKSVPGKLTHVPFKNAVQPLFETKLKGLTEEKIVQLLINFMSAVEDILVQSQISEKKLSNAAFFQALFFAFPGILEQVQLQQKDLKKDAFKQVLKPLGNIDWEKHSGTNKKEIEKLSRHISDLVGANGKIDASLI